MKTKSFAPAPFWFLNHRLEENEILRQMRLMKESGVSGFFIHPRAGLLTPYGSEEWFQMVRLIVEEASRLGLEAWLYDEDPYPSGAVGGRIMMENAAFIARSLRHQLTKPDENGDVDIDLGCANVLTAFSFFLQENGEISDVKEISGAVGVLREAYFKSPWFNSYYCDWREDRPYPHERAETFFPHMVLKTKINPGYQVMVIYTEMTNSGKYGCIPDCLNPECVKRFIELTHEKYKEWVGEYFGTTIPGVFTDEPFLGGSLPWTDALEDTFYSLHGYHLRPELYRMWLGNGEASHRLRRNYWATVRHLYRTSFFGQLSDWCHRNGLEFVGHVNSEEDPVSHSRDGGAYSNMKYLDSPGLDILAQNLGNRERPALLFGAHSVASAARQLGKKRVLCEALACNPYSFGPRDMRRVTNWLYSQGVNFIVPHGFHYSYAGNRKHDAGKSFFFQDPYFEEFPNYAIYADRMGRRLAEGTPTGNTALLQLADEIDGFMPSEPGKAKEVRHHLFRAVAALNERHIEYENISTETILDGKIEAGAVILGERRYTQVLVPAADDYRTPLIERMLENGVQVYFGLHGIFDWETILAGATYTALSGEGTEDVLVNRMSQEDSLELFLFNNSETVASLCLDGEWTLWDADEDTYYRVEWPLKLSGYGACLLKEQQTSNLPCWTHAAKPFEPLCQEWVYRPKGALITIHKWKMRFETALGSKVDTEQEFCLVRDVIGTELTYMQNAERPIFDLVPLVPSPYPVQMTAEASFILSDTGENRRLIIEEAAFRGVWELSLNGHRLTMQDFKPCFLYDFTNCAADVTALLQEGENILTVLFRDAGEFDGMESAIYLA